MTGPGTRSSVKRRTRRSCGRWIFLFLCQYNAKMCECHRLLRIAQVMTRVMEVYTKEAELLEPLTEPRWPLSWFYNPIMHFCPTAICWPFQSVCFWQQGCLGASTQNPFLPMPRGFAECTRRCKCMIWYIIVGVWAKLILAWQAIRTTEDWAKARHIFRFEACLVRARA